MAESKDQSPTTSFNDRNGDIREANGFQRYPTSHIFQCRYQLVQFDEVVSERIHDGVRPNVLRIPSI